MNLESNLDLILDDIKAGLDSIRTEQYIEFEDPCFGSFAAVKDITTDFSHLDERVLQLRQIQEGVSALGINLPMAVLRKIKHLEIKAYGMGYFGAYYILNFCSGNKENYAEKLRYYQNLMR